MTLVSSEIVRRGLWHLLILVVASGMLASCSRVQEDGNRASWPQFGGDASGAYYSPADQINASNLDKLGLAFEFTDFEVRGRTHRGLEATPIVVGKTMYLTGPWSVVYALDAQTGRERWRYDPHVDGAYARRSCCDAVNRGVAVHDGLVYVASLDGYLVALDAANGNVRWRADTFIDRSRSYTSTGAPRIAGHVVVIGNGGAEMGVRGYVSAYDLASGKLAWRFFIVPGDPAKGDESPDVTMARRTWSPRSRWDLGGGGTAWDSMIYDPDTNLLVVGTGNGMPHPAWLRSPGGGDNLFLSSIVALDAGTGRLRWHYQTTPGDSWDYTATQNLIFADLTIEGRPRKVVMQAPKNGFFYVLDRATGKLLSADKYTAVTWADYVDLATGRPVLTGQGDYSKSPRIVWPSEFGGHSWHPMSFSPRTGLVYIPVLETPMKFTTAAQPYMPYSVLQGDVTASPPFRAGDPALAGPQPRPVMQSRLVAWDPIRRRVAWSTGAGIFWRGGALSTGSGLTVEGDAAGYLSFYDSKDGRLVRKIFVGTAIMAAPMTYSIDGQQFIAVLAGMGGALNLEYPVGSVARDRDNSERLLVFRLGGGAILLPTRSTPGPMQPAADKYRGTDVEAASGEKLFDAHCAACHGDQFTVGGYPNLWNLPPEVHQSFDQIVLAGAFQDAGMASFADVLSTRDAHAIHAWISRKAPAAAAANRTNH